MRGWVIISLGAVAGAVVAAFVWERRADMLPAGRRPTVIARSASDREPPAIPPLVQVDHPKEPPRAKPNLRESLRTSRDFATLVKTMLPAASAGDPEAQYVAAQALRYCDENLKRFFRKSNGSLRTFGQAQSRWANRPAAYQEEIVDVYDRCHAFLDNQDLVNSPPSWTKWLDRAAAAGYAPAEAEKADDIRSAAVMANAGKEPDQPQSSPELERAASIALSAAESGDPDALIKMANWVNPRGHSAEDYESLVSAWQLVACQRGYDCGPTSEWLRSLCNYDVQCAGGQTFTDYLERRLGERYENVVSLAKQIQAALSAGDDAAIRSHL